MTVATMIALAAEEAEHHNVALETVGFGIIAIVVFVSLALVTLTYRNVAPLQKAPFYAVKVVPGSLGTFAGLQVNANAQVLDAQGEPIAGLYAGGNDMNSVMGGHYPSGGITLGPAMTFGFIAAHHAGAPHPEHHTLQRRRNEREPAPIE